MTSVEDRKGVIIISSCFSEEEEELSLRYSQFRCLQRKREVPKGIPKWMKGWD